MYERLFTVKNIIKKISVGLLTSALLFSSVNVVVFAGDDESPDKYSCFYGARGLPPESEVIVPYAVTDNIHAHLEFYTDAEKTVPLKGELPKDRYVYYTVAADERYLCRRFVLNAEYVDEEKFMLGDREYSAYAETYLMGDVTDDRIVNTEDLVRLMKCISNKHLNQYLFEVEWPCADANMDNKVDSKDLVRTMRIVSGERVESPACKSAAAAVESSETRLDALQTDEAKWDVWNVEDRNTKLTVINSVEELKAWEEKFSAEYPYDKPEKSNGDPYGKKPAGVSINYEKYTEEYFAEHTLAIVSTPVTNNAFDAPAYIDSELRGDVLTVIMEKRYGRGVIAGGDPAVANSFIELPRTDAEKVALEVKPDYYELLCENG